MNIISIQYLHTFASYFAYQCISLDFSVLQVPLDKFQTAPIKGITGPIND